MRIVKTKTTYLEMFAPPEKRLAPPRDDVEVVPLDVPTVDYYRFLYNTVGSNWAWYNRLIIPEEELRAIIEHELVDIYVLHVAGNEAGFAELDRRTPGEIELAYFGIFPDFVGKGLGTYLLNWAQHTAWSHQPRRLWLHTCDLDHPAAIPTYQKGGFVIYDEKICDQHIPDDGELPTS